MGTIGLSGCSAVIGLGVANATAKVQTDNDLRLSKMNCGQLRAEYVKKCGEFLGAASAGIVLQKIKGKGCHLPS